MRHRSTSNRLPRERWSMDLGLVVTMPWFAPARVGRLVFWTEGGLMGYRAAWEVTS